MEAQEAALDTEQESLRKYLEEAATEKEKEAKEWHENQVRKCELFPFTEMDYTHENECKEGASNCRQLAKWLKEIKQLREQTKWIPCSERLPKENVKVLTQDYDGDIQVDWLVDLELRWFYSQHHIVAWQPLPKPYKAEKGE